MSLKTDLWALPMLYALRSPGVQSLIRKYENRKPDYYKVSLSKQERKGKTQEEILAMRIEKYDRMVSV